MENIKLQETVFVLPWSISEVKKIRCMQLVYDCLVPVCFTQCQLIQLNTY